MNYYGTRKRSTPKQKVYYVSGKKGSESVQLMAYRDYDTVDGYRYHWNLKSGLGTPTNDLKLATRWAKEACEKFGFETFVKAGR